MRKTTSISLQGDKHYIGLLRLIASKYGITIGELVREALDNHYHEDIEAADSFFAPNVASKQHRQTSVTTN